jgi:hypothetical protein
VRPEGLGKLKKFNDLIGTGLIYLYNFEGGKFLDQLIDYQPTKKGTLHEISFISPTNKVIWLQLLNSGQTYTKHQTLM